MSLRAAIDLISSELPHKVLADIEEAECSGIEANDVSIRDFSMGRISNSEEFKSGLEKKLRIVEGQEINHTLRKFNQQRFNFVKEVTGGEDTVELCKGIAWSKSDIYFF